MGMKTLGARRRSKQISFYEIPDVKDRITQAAIRAGLRDSDWLRQVVRTALEASERNFRKEQERERRAADAV